MRWFNKLCIPLIILIVFISAKNLQWGGNNWKGIIESDGKGYYAYLPAVFVYQDLNFSFFDSVEAKYKHPATFYDYRANVDGKICNKYFAGTAIAMSPFFLIAQLVSSDRDGYSQFYFIMIGVAGIFYLWLGLYFLKKLLKCYVRNDTLINFVLILVTFATNLFYYAACEPAMSHIYSFAFVTLFIYHSKKYFLNNNFKSARAVSFLLGLIILIRPVNSLVVLLLPFIAGDWGTFKRGTAYLLGTGRFALSCLLILFLIVGIQFLIYKIQTGQFFVDTYVGENFKWLSPHPIDFLVSYKKGLFIYSPFLLFCLFGLYTLFKQNRFVFYSVSIFFVILIYVLSSWWNWWYGGSFGSRVMVEYYAVFSILLLMFLDKIRSQAAKMAFSAVLVVTLLLAQFQIYQYRYYHIHWEKMDQEHYWRSFMRIDLLIKKENPNADLLGPGS